MQDKDYETFKKFSNQLKPYMKDFYNAANEVLKGQEKIVRLNVLVDTFLKLMKETLIIKDKDSADKHIGLPIILNFLGDMIITATNAFVKDDVSQEFLSEYLQNYDKEIAPDAALRLAILSDFLDYLKGEAKEAFITMQPRVYPSGQGG